MDAMTSRLLMFVYHARKADYWCLYHAVETYLGLNLFQKGTLLRSILDNKNGRIF